MPCDRMQVIGCTHASPPLLSTRALMTLPRAVSDRLMRVASFSRSPDACVLLCRSLPARSTRFSLPTRMWPPPCISQCVFALPDRLGRMSCWRRREIPAHLCCHPLSHLHGDDEHGVRAQGLLVHQRRPPPTCSSCPPATTRGYHLNTHGAGMRSMMSYSDTARSPPQVWHLEDLLHFCRALHDDGRQPPDVDAGRAVLPHIQRLVRLLGKQVPHVFIVHLQEGHPHLHVQMLWSCSMAQLEATMKIGQRLADGVVAAEEQRLCDPPGTAGGCCAARHAQICAGTPAG